MSKLTAVQCVCVCVFVLTGRGANLTLSKWHMSVFACITCHSVSKKKTRKRWNRIWTILAVIFIVYLAKIKLFKCQVFNFLLSEYFSYFFGVMWKTLFLLQKNFWRTCTHCLLNRKRWMAKKRKRMEKVEKWKGEQQVKNSEERKREKGGWTAERQRTRYKLQTEDRTSTDNSRQQFAEEERKKELLTLF